MQKNKMNNLIESLNEKNIRLLKFDIDSNSYWDIVPRTVYIEKHIKYKFILINPVTEPLQSHDGLRDKNGYLGLHNMVFPVKDYYGYYDFYKFNDLFHNTNRKYHIHEFYVVPHTDKFIFKKHCQVISIDTLKSESYWFANITASGLIAGFCESRVHIEDFIETMLGRFIK